MRGTWFEDGPLLPIEFARESADKRITLVIGEVELTVRSLWTLLSVASLDEARRKLAEREKIAKNIEHFVGFWENATDISNGRGAPQVRAWAKRLGLDAVVWTNLPFGFKDKRDEMPKYKQVLEHIERLSLEERRVAEEYIRRAPVQIDTEFRRKFQRDLGWTPKNNMESIGVGGVWPLRSRTKSTHCHDRLEEQF